MSAAVMSQAPAAQLLRFVSPMLGLGDFAEFLLEPLDDSGLLYSLNSTNPNGPRMFVVDPAPFFPTYKPAVGSAVFEKLQSAQPRVLVIVTAGEAPAPHTANLLAPIVLNDSSGAALQVVLEDDSWPLRATFG